MLPPLGIRQKILALFILTALVPLIVINIIWLRSSQHQLKQAAANRQSILLTSSAQRFNESLDAKINDVISHSQDQSIIDFNIEQSRLKLLQYAASSPDVLRIALIDTAGNEQVVVQNSQLSTSLKNVKDSDAFKVVTQVSNEASLSPVTYANGVPKITIAVPLLSVGKLGDQNLTTVESLVRRFGSDIKGALIVDVSLSNLWQSVLSVKLGNDGYAYIIDQKGAPIAYSDPKFMSTHTSLLGTGEVNNAVKTLGAQDLQKVAATYTPQPGVTTSEKGVGVLSSYFPISRAKWAIIGEEPISSVYRDVNNVSRIAVLIFLLAIPTSFVLVLLATRNIIVPIRSLTAEALRMGSGDFEHTLTYKGKDELGVLAKTFNKMSYDLQSLINRYKEQNLSLTAERAKLQAVLDTITDGVLVLNKDFTIVLANKTIAALASQTNPKSLNGQPWLEVLRLTYKDQPFDNGLLIGSLLYFNDVVLKLGEQQKYIDITAVQLYDDPTGIAYILTIHDITEQQEFESMKIDFVSMAAHELRTPLTSIRGYLELINNQPQELTPIHRSYLQRSIISSKLLSSLINNLLNVSNIERGELNVAWEKVDLAHIITAAVHDQLMAAQEKGLSLTYKGPEAGLWVIGDEVLLREVVTNLISNAIHYTEIGQITVDSHESEGIITTSVQDTGPGIPADSLLHLFTKFYRGHTTLTSTNKGTGLGLYLSKAIVESHHGTIKAESEEGVGSTFSFYLPTFNQARYDALVADTKHEDSVTL